MTIGRVNLGICEEMTNNFLDIRTSSFKITVVWILKYLHGLKTNGDISLCDKNEMEKVIKQTYYFFTVFGLDGYGPVLSLIDSCQHANFLQTQDINLKFSTHCFFQHIYYLRIKLKYLLLFNVGYKFCPFKKYV
jgi:hypothetical protein